MPDDDLAAALAGIRERAKAAADLPLAELAEFTGPDTKSIGGWIAASALDVPRLLAAVEAALKLADDWDAEGMRLDAQAYERCARELREALTTALAGEEDPGGLEARPR